MGNKPTTHSHTASFDTLRSNLKDKNPRLNLEDLSLEHLPALKLKNYKHLTEINLSGNNLLEIPADARDLVNLRILVLDRNALVQLPTGFEGLPSSLTKLSLGNNRLTAKTLQPHLLSLTGLTSLNLSKNSIESVDFLWSAAGVSRRSFISSNSEPIADLLNRSTSVLSNLTYLNLKNNAISSVPNEICLLHSLRALDLSYNQISSSDGGVSDKLWSLTSLEVLGLSHNMIADVVTTPLQEESALKLLQVFDISYNLLHQESLRKLHIHLFHFLSHLNLSHNQIESLYVEMQQLVNLIHLDLSDNRLSSADSIPMGVLSSMKKLRFLSLRKNGILELPWEALDGLIVLEELDVSFNNLTSLRVGPHLTGLTTLIATRNRLTEPSSVDISSLSKLRTLDLISNELTGIGFTGISSVFGSLVSLRLGYNRISSIQPDIIPAMISLTELDLDGNEINSAQLDLFTWNAGNTPRQKPDIHEFRETPLKSLSLRFNEISDDHRAALLKSGVAERVFTDNAQADEIIDHLFLGPRSAGFCRHLLSRLNVSHVIQLMTGVEPRFKREITYLSIPVEDDESVNIAQYFDSTNKFIETALKDGTGCLVCSDQGNSRGVIVIAAYLIKKRNLAPQEAIAHIKLRRPKALPNRGFTKQLVESAKQSGQQASTNPAENLPHAHSLGHGADNDSDDLNIESADDEDEEPTIATETQPPQPQPTTVQGEPPSEATSESQQAPLEQQKPSPSETETNVEVAPPAPEESSLQIDLSVAAISALSKCRDAMCIIKNTAGSVLGVGFVISTDYPTQQALLVTTSNVLSSEDEARAVSVTNVGNGSEVSLLPTVMFHRCEGPPKLLENYLFEAPSPTASSQQSQQQQQIPQEPCDRPAQADICIVACLAPENTPTLVVPLPLPISSIPVIPDEKVVVIAVPQGDSSRDDGVAHVVFQVKHVFRNHMSYSREPQRKKADSHSVVCGCLVLNSTGEFVGLHHQSQNDRQYVIRAGALYNILLQTRSLGILRGVPDIIVDSMRERKDLGPNEYNTIQVAIEAVTHDFQQIVIRPGKYREKIRIGEHHRNAILYGDGKKNSDVLIGLVPNEYGDMVVSHDDFEQKPMAVMESTSALIANLTIKQTDNNNLCVSVTIAGPDTKGPISHRPQLWDCCIQGGYSSLDIERETLHPTVSGCEIKEAQGHACLVIASRTGLFEYNTIAKGFRNVVIRADCDPVLRYNDIMRADRSSVFLVAGSRGVFEYNRIRNNRQHGVEIKGVGANPLLRFNDIGENTAACIMIYDQGEGVFESNSFHHSAFGISLRESSLPVFRRCDVFRCEQGGIHVHRGGKGTFTQNKIHHCAKHGVVVEDEGSEPTFSENEIFENRQNGMFIMTGSRCSVSSNRIHDNAIHGISVKDQGVPFVRKNDITANKQSGIYIMNAAGTFVENKIYANEIAGVVSKETSDPTVKQNDIHDHSDSGVLMEGACKGTFEENKIHRNGCGIALRGAADPLVRSNEIFENKSTYQRAASSNGVFENNELHDNVDQRQ